MMHVVICDDEAHTREQLEQALLRFGKEQDVALEIQKFSSGDSLLQEYPQELDLLLLDIAMAGIDGVEAAKRIRTFDSEVQIIFITTMFQRAIEGYAIRALGFIKKPVRYAELRHEMAYAVRQISRKRAEGHFITLHARGNAYRMPVEEISYCEVRGHSMRVCINGAVNEYRCTVRELESALRPYGFFRCHASYLVSGRFVRQIGSASLTLKDGTEIPISQRRKKEFLSLLSGYLGEQM